MPCPCPWLPNPQVVKWDDLKKRRAANAFNLRSGDVEDAEMVMSRAGAIRLLFRRKIKVPGAPDLDSIPLFTFTSKMSAASFSLPAGLGKYNGTCPASNEEIVKKYQVMVPTVDPDTIKRKTPEGLPHRFICSVCYAGGGRYSWAKYIHIAQEARRLWVISLLRKSPTAFTEAMVRALTMLTTRPIPLAVTAAKKCNPHYFRIHDSGDYLNHFYAKAWGDVAATMQHIRFWAPTRTWIYQDWRNVFSAYANVKNYTVRPSSLYVSSPPPTVNGMAAGTMCAKGKQLDARPPRAVLPKGVKDCPAYRGETSMHTCEAQQCRTCWDQPEMSVNYREH